MTNDLEDRYCRRLQELKFTGQGILAAAKYQRLQPQASTGTAGSLAEMNETAFAQWRVNYASLLNNIFVEGSPGRPLVSQYAQYSDPLALLPPALGILAGIQDDIEKGFLGKLNNRIESEIAVDYMSQAEQLLDGDTSEIPSHVPAAVLAGAVLERALRALCQQQVPPIPLTDPRRKQKTLDPLIDDLKKAKLFVEATAKQLRSWAGLRNLAAHGHFEDLRRQDVELMIKGIKNFLEEYLR